ncbi:MAG: biotin/lipoate--protein ligase family protein, partial [Rickettsiales bacterium]
MRPECKIAEAAQLSLVAALGLGDAISEYVAPSRVRNKWPNDVLVDGRKIAGLLLESSSNGGGALDWVVVGCGVNVANSPDL